MEIGDILFDDENYSSVAEWCNDHDAHIEEIEKDDEGNRRFQIVANPPPEPLTTEEIQRQLSDAVQNALDEFARTRLYDGIMSACSYANSTNTKFQMEAEHCIALRDATWSECYRILDEVKAGSRDIPTTEELLAELPVSSAVWPDDTDSKEITDESVSE